MVPLAAQRPVSHAAEPSTVLHGRRLYLTRIVWLGLMLVLLGLYLAGTLERFRTPATVCASGCAMTAEEADSWRAWGLSPTAATAYFNILWSVVMPGGFIAVAALIAWRKSNDWMALLVALALVALGPYMLSGINLDLKHRLGVPFFIALLEKLFITAFVVLYYVFPDGRFVPRWTRWWVLLFAVLIWAPESLMPAADWLWIGHFFAMMAVGLAAQIYRYRRVSTRVQRQQTKWVILGFAGPVLTLAMWFFASAYWLRPGRTMALFSLGALPIMALLALLWPLSIGVAILRYRLWDVDILLNRALVYSALSAAVVGLYVLVVVGIGRLLDVGDNLPLSLVATGLVAVLFQPLRLRVQHAVNRLMFGERDDPYAVLSRLGQRLESTLAPDAVLPAIVEIVAQALKLPYVAIALQQDDGMAVVAAAGTPVAEPLRLPLVSQAEHVGALLLAQRGPDEALNSADRRLLNDLAHQIGSAAHAVRLTADLQRSRQRIVTTREEERRRLRRDLHDGLGPMLGSLTLKLDVADDLVDRDPTRAHALLRSLKEQTQTAIADIRRLVYALRPPALDDLGLVAALRDVAAQHVHDGLHITVDACEPLPPLPAAVEVAAYRIVQEALTNVVRHAGARTCTIRLELDTAAGVLGLEVLDDGRGLGSMQRRGVGLQSMHERAAELGGACMLEGGANGGARVCARLPLPAARGPEQGTR